MKIRVFSLILAIVISAFCFSACSSDKKEPALEPVKGGELVLSTKVVDGKVHAEVSVVGNPGIAGFNISLRFDNTKLTPSEMISSDLIGDSIHSNIAQSPDTLEKLDFVTAVYVNAVDFKGDGLLYTMVFDIDEGATGDTFIAIDAESIVNAEYRDVIFEVKSGKVTLG